MLAFARWQLSAVRACPDADLTALRRHCSITFLALNV